MFEKGERGNHHTTDQQGRKESVADRGRRKTERKSQRRKGGKERDPSGRTGEITFPYLRVSSEGRKKRPPSTSLTDRLSAKKKKKKKKKEASKTVLAG